MKIGAHVSSAISIDLSFDRAKEIGAECMQIFISPPQMWLQKKYSDESISKFREKFEESGIGPNFIHGAYLINLATDIPDNLEKAKSWLKYSLDTASKLGINGTIFHLGSHKGRGFDKVEKQVCLALEEILKEAPGDANLILENAAGAGGCIGANFQELGHLIKSVQDKRLKVCFDTQHGFAMGVDAYNKDGLDRTVEEIANTVGLDRIEVFHLNDSKTEFGSKKDRHENIGDGKIGDVELAMFLNHPAFRDKPFVLEVPGIKGEGPDKENIIRARNLVKF